MKVDKITIVGLAIIGILLTSGASKAEQQNLRCRLMSKAINNTEVKAPGDHTILTAFQDGGVCLFEDGRVADKVFVAAKMAKRPEQALSQVEIVRGTVSHGLISRLTYPLEVRRNTIAYA